MNRLLPAIVICLCSALAAAQVYRTTDSEGNVVYTDAPPAGTAAEPVHVPPPNTADAPQPIYPPAEPAPAPVEEAATSIAIIAPADETSIPMGPGNFSVSAEARPLLRDGESLQLLIDGKPHGKPQQAGTWNLTNVFRGKHELKVQVVGEGGGTIATSAPVTVYVHRPSVNFK